MIKATVWTFKFQPHWVHAKCAESLINTSINDKGFTASSEKLLKKFNPLINTLLCVIKQINSLSNNLPFTLLMLRYLLFHAQKNQYRPTTSLVSSNEVTVNGKRIPYEVQQWYSASIREDGEPDAALFYTNFKQRMSISGKSTMHSHSMERSCIVGCIWLYKSQRLN